MINICDKKMLAHMASTGKDLRKREPVAGKDKDRMTRQICQSWKKMKLSTVKGNRMLRQNDH